MRGREVGGRPAPIAGERGLSCLPSDRTVGHRHSGTQTSLGRALPGAVLSRPLRPRPASPCGDTDGFIEGCRGPTCVRCPHALALARGPVVRPLVSLIWRDPVPTGSRRRRGVGLRLVPRRRFCLLRRDQPKGALPWATNAGSASVSHEMSVGRDQDSTREQPPPGTLSRGSTVGLAEVQPTHALEATGVLVALREHARPPQRPHDPLRRDRRDRRRLRPALAPRPHRGGVVISQQPTNPFA
jgi:hypothetical protein